MSYKEQLLFSKKKTYVYLLFTYDKLSKIYDKFLFGLEDEINSFINKNLNTISYKKIYLCKNSKMDLIDYENIDARIEYGAIIRQNVTIKKNAVIMMNSVINIGATIGENTMIDMGAVVGSGAMIGNNCHIGANAVISGEIEPASKKVIIKDNVLIGANAFIKSGVTINEYAIIGAGAVVLNDVEKNAIVAGVPAKKIDSNYEFGIEKDLR